MASAGPETFDLLRGMGFWVDDTDTIF